MRSTFGGLEIAKRGLFAQQTALSTTAHNMGNANTRGYSRQVVNLVASRPMEAVGMQRSVAAGQIGMGVEALSITRVRETFLDGQFYNENKSLGEWSIRRDTMEKLESIMNEPSDTGVRQVIQNFWNAWQELSKAPDNMTARAIVKESSLALTDAFNHTAKQLKDLSADLTNSITTKVSGINSSVGQIATLNSEIYRLEGLGNNANDLRDQRDLLVDDLSKVINVAVVEDTNGYNVSMGTVQLTNGFNVETIVTAASLQASYTAGDLNDGEVAGMIVSRDTFVAGYRAQFDALAQTIATGPTEVILPVGVVVPEGTVIGTTTYTGTVAARTLAAPVTITVNGMNGLHQLGYMYKNGTVTTGGLFFVAKDGASAITAENFSLNPDIAKDIEQIAASMRTYVDQTDNTEKVVNGNNTMALLIAGLRDQKFNFDPTLTGTVAINSGTLNEFFTAVVAELGIQTQEAIRQSNNQRILVDQIESRRQSVSGVSLDEETANMIKFQHAYNAAARSLTTFDEMLDKVINGMGIVGR